jgi:hypothetical protein
MPRPVTSGSPPRLGSDGERTPLGATYARRPGPQVCLLACLGVAGVTRQHATSGAVPRFDLPRSSSCARSSGGRRHPVRLTGQGSQRALGLPHLPGAKRGYGDSFARAFA